MVSGQRLVLGLSGAPAVAAGVRLSSLRRTRRVVDSEGPVDVWVVRSADFGDRGDHFHRIRSPLSTWFAAIWFITSQKNGMSAHGLQRVLGFISYDTSWAWLHKLRRAWSGPSGSCSVVWSNWMQCSLATSLAGRAGGVKDHTAAMIAVE